MTAGDEPYWLAGRAPPAPVPLPKRAGVAVVGGGLMGTAAAYWLARGGADVVLLEARRLASGATGRNIGVVLPGSGPLERPGFTTDLLAEEGIDADYAQPGHLTLASSNQVWHRFRDEASGRRPSAPSLGALDRRECEELIGRRISPRFPGGRWYPGGRTLDPVALVEGIARAAARRGARIVCGTRAVATGPAGSLVQVRTDSGLLCAETVVYACGVGAVRLQPALGALISPARGQVLATVPLPRFFPVAMAVDWGSVYWRQTRDGVVLLGGRRAVDARPEASPEEALNPRIQRALDRFLGLTFPGFPQFRVARRWAGIMDCTPDDRPLIGRIPGRMREWILTGFGGHGLPAGIGAGRALADAVLRDTPPPESFSLERFGPDLGA